MSKCIEYSDTTPDVTFTYDRLGRQTTVTDALGQRTLNYNTSLQLQSEAITGLYDKTITRTYSPDNMIGRSTGYTIGTEYAMTYGYDPSGRFSSIGWTAGTSIGTASYSYVTNSDLLAQMTTPTGLQTTYTYETNRNLKTQVKNEYGTQIISQYDYQYDTIGRRENVTNSGTAFTASAFNNYNYNDRNELTESARYQGTDITDTANPVQSEYRQYTYDPIGNRTAITEGTDTGTYTTNNLNQYTDQTVPANGNKTLAYDADGNLTGITGGTENKTYTYNAENRLIAVEPPIPADGDKKVEFAYDYMGRRIKKVVSIYSSSAWTQETEKLFVYDGWNLVEEMTTSGGPQTTKYYVWGLDLSQSLQGAGGIGGLIASVDDTNIYYFYYDGNGNVGQLVDSSDGSIAAHYEYDGYGKEIVASGAEAGNNVFRFSTKYYDEESDLYYYGYRYYSMGLGRWLTKDPIQEEGGVNRYVFVANSPSNDVDPFGLFGIFVHTDGTGHIGVQTIFNSSPRNYDFGRYYGRYKWSYSGPNILRKTTSANPSSYSKTGYKMYNFDASDELDNIISKMFRSKFDSGRRDIPQTLKKKMMRYAKNKKFRIGSNERYMGNDWGLTGPNCITFSFNSLHEALDKVIDGKNYSEEIKCEAERIKKMLEKIKGIFTLRPVDVKENLEEIDDLNK